MNGSSGSTTRICYNRYQLNREIIKIISDLGEIAGINIPECKNAQNYRACALNWISKYKDPLEGLEYVIKEKLKEIRGEPEFFEENLESIKEIAKMVGKKNQEI